MCQFLVESMTDLQSKGYIEHASEFSAESGHEWYLPYFVTSQVKKRIVYDGKSEWQGRCVNDVLMSGPDLLNPLVHVLTRFRRGKFGLMADITKCFFQIALPESQRDLFRILWFENDNIDTGKIVPYRFCVHPWGIKSSPYIACLAFKKMIEQNPSNASELTLSSVSENMYMDDFIFSVDSLEDAQMITNESIALFRGRGFNLVKWSANKEALSVMSNLDSELLAPSIREIDLEVDNVALPSAKTVGCVWVTESDELRIQCSLKPLSKYTRRTMLSQLGQNFDPLGFGAPFFVRARLILQQLAKEKFDWDTEVPQEFVKQWNSWLRALELLKDYSLPRWYFSDSSFCQVSDDVQYQLHAFSDASNQVFSSVVYLRRLVNGVPCVAFVLGKCTIVLTNQSSWAIARKELVAALATAKLLKVAFDALKLPDCSKYFWCDSRSVLQWIKNPDLRVNKFIARRVDHILLLSDETDWRFCPTKINAADVGSRPDLIVKADSRHLWLNGPSFLCQNVEVPVPELQDDVVVVAHKLNSFTAGRDEFDELIARAPSLYVLSKRVAYLTAFVDFVHCRAKKCPFIKPVLNAAYLDRALDSIVKIVKNKVYGEAIMVMREKLPDALEGLIKRRSVGIVSDEEKVHLKELRSLENTDLVLIKTVEFELKAA